MKQRDVEADWEGRWRAMREMQVKVNKYRPRRVRGSVAGVWELNGRPASTSANHWTPRAVQRPGVPYLLIASYGVARFAALQRAARQRCPTAFPHTWDRTLGASVAHVTDWLMQVQV